MAPESWSSWLRPVAWLWVVTGPVLITIGLLNLSDEANAAIPHEYTWAWIELVLGIVQAVLGAWILRRNRAAPES
jgi:uncharacterized membrane protein